MPCSSPDDLKATSRQNTTVVPGGDSPDRGLWAKTRQDGSEDYHPLLLHLLDAACCADAILAREPAGAREQMASLLGLPWDRARPWLLLLIACHDLGKACPGFQSKWPVAVPRIKAWGLPFPPGSDQPVNHAWVSQVSLPPYLQELGWPAGLANLVADAVGCHHGERAGAARIARLRFDPVNQAPAWIQAREKLFKVLLAFFKPCDLPMALDLPGPAFMLLAGLTSFADWIGSNEDHFRFGSATDCQDLEKWWKDRTVLAGKALDSIRWRERTPLLASPRPFQDIFEVPPRPLQVATTEAVRAAKGPCILLIEAPMGEGKTEAAFFAHLELQRRFGHRGLYIALPTRATGNAMFTRTLRFLQRLAPGKGLDLQLLHGGTALNDTYQDLRKATLYDPEGNGRVRTSEWFTARKRSLLSDYGVGTVDQALITILPVRHHFVRLWGLANRVVIFDEIHAYDAYTGTLLLHLIGWLMALGSSVILLSATLPPRIRRSLAALMRQVLPEADTAYPRLTMIDSETIRQHPFSADPSRRRSIDVIPLLPDLAAIRLAVDAHLPSGSALILVNTVQRAQNLYGLFPEGTPLLKDGVQVGKALEDGTEILLFHARFPADSRQKREDHALEMFGPKAGRLGRRILLATQVAEQSLDLDFDLLISDLAPVDLLLQRAGRLWRHERTGRPLPRPKLIVAGLAGDEPCKFEAPLWWSSVYREDLLLRTWMLLRTMPTLQLPDQIDDLVETVYEEREPVPETLQDRMDEAMTREEGKVAAQRCQAHQAIIGLPGDGSWNDPGRFTQADEDEPGLHPTLRALTRLGDPSLTLVPILAGEGFDPAKTPTADQIRAWSRRTCALTSKRVVGRLQALGVPVAWQQCPLLRTVYPLLLDPSGSWTEDATVHLDEALGLVVDMKEVP